MASPRTSFPRLLLATLVAVAGCVPGAPTGTTPKAPGASRKPTTTSPTSNGRASAGPGVVASSGTGSVLEARLTGAVRLLSNNGGGIISDNGGGIISNNGGTIISDNGGGVVSNNGATYALADRGPRFRLAAKAAEALLADADVAVVDAAGAPVKGPDGAPIVGRTDRTGRFAIAAALPAGNLVLRVKLWTGGELRALLVRGAGATTNQDVDTASSLGAAFVLERLVKGDQGLLDKLPAAEAARLQRELEASRELLAAAPTYDATALAASAEELRRKAGGVDAVLTSIEALLLGQKNLGDGRPADEVPLNRAFGLTVEPDGTLLIAESGLGRLRAVDRGGRIATRLDKARGVIKENLVGLHDLARAPDGSLYLAADRIDDVRRIAPDGTYAPFKHPAIAELDVRSLAVRPDGTLLVGGGKMISEFGRIPLWVAIAPDGTATEGAPVGPEHGWFCGISPAADGGVHLLRRSPGATPDDPFVGSLHHVAADGTHRLVAADMVLSSDADLHRGPDGTLYVTESGGARVLAFAPDGTRTVVPGPETTGGAPFIRPAGVHAAPDGTLYVSDLGDARVHARGADGRWRVVAGVDGLAKGGDASTIALNAPSSVEFDRAGRLLITENGRHRILRLAEGKLEAIAGGPPGFAGDGGPASAALFNGPTGVRFRGDELLVIDAANRRLRRIAPDGTISTLAGVEGRRVPPRDPAPYPPDRADFERCIDLTMGPDGRPYWTDVDRQQVLTLAAPDRVEAVFGALAPKAVPTLAEMLADLLPDGQAAGEATLRMPLGLAFDAKGDLYVADSGHGLIRKVTGLAAGAPRVEAFAGRGPGAIGEVIADPAGALRDGPRREIDFAVPGGLAFDAAGNLYVVELGSRRLDMLTDIVEGGFPIDFSALPALPPRVRKIAPDGQVTTIAGPGGRFFADPDAEDALIMPTAIAIAPDGRLAIADPGANLVRIIPAGTF